MSISYNKSRRQSSQALVVISTGIFLLAVLFTMVKGIGFYVSLGLVVVGCFSMIIVGILREPSARELAMISRSISVEDVDDS